MIVINESNFYRDERDKTRRSNGSGPRFIYNLDQLKKDPNLYGRLMDMSEKEIKGILQELGLSGNEISSLHNKYRRVDKAYELLGGK